MAIMPGAIFKPITANKGRDRLLEHNRQNVHIADGNASGLGLWNYYNKPGQVDSHFYVLKNGEIWQYVDTDFQAFADLDGNDATISVENQAKAGEAPTQEQIEANARIFKWLRQVHGIKNKIASNSFIGDSSHGLSWHRLGCDGNFPAMPSPYAGRIQRGGGMRYSKVQGKICPTEPWIDVIPEIFRLSQDSNTPEPPVEIEEEEEEMKGFFYTRTSDGVKVTVLFNEVSGFCSEVQGTMGAKNNEIATAWKTGSFVEVTESHANALKRDLEKVRQGN